VPITTKVVGSNLAHGEVYSIQQCVIIVVSDLMNVNGTSMLVPMKNKGKMPSM
jgi:hypothetical protein